MAKRFTDSEKWKDPWFRKLPPIGKCIWTFLLDNCDHAGIWKVDIELMNFHIGSDWTKPMIKECLNGRIQEINNGKEWFLSAFIEFQYNVLPKNLDKNNRVHYSVLQILKNKGLTRGYKAPKDKDKDKDMDKDQDKEREDFNKARKIFPGTKRGLDTEFDNFKKKHKDWVKVLSLLKPAIENQIEWENEKLIKTGEITLWKHFQTWINQRCWEYLKPKTKTVMDVL